MHFRNAAPALRPYRGKHRSASPASSPRPSATGAVFARARSAGVLALVTTIVTLAFAVQPATAAGGVSARITSTSQSRTGSVAIAGTARDTGTPSRTVAVCVTLGGGCSTVVHTRGAFHTTVRAPKRAVTVTLRDSTRTGRVLARVRVQTPGQRIVAQARRWVGRARYVEGGSTPRHGFDCSGYTGYVYRTAKVASLRHYTEWQRHAKGMRRISRSAARPGDLIFYLSGGTSYHVAIYAGHGKQYAAATPRDGIRYQPIWSSHIEFRTDWH